MLDILVQSRRNAKAAKRLLRKLLKSQGIAPRVMITDKPASYGAAKREIMPGIDMAMASPYRVSSQNFGLLLAAFFLRPRTVSTSGSCLQARSHTR